MNGRFHRQDRPSVTMKIAIHPAVKRAFLRQYKKSCYISPAVVVQALMVLYLTDRGRPWSVDAGHYRPAQNSPARRARRRHALKLHEFLTTDDPDRRQKLQAELVNEKNPEDQ